MKNAYAHGLAVIAVVLLALPLIASGDWPQYLGPNRTGHVPEGFNAARWPDGGAPRVLWQTRAGNGIASPVVAGGRLYTMGSLKPEANASDGVSLEEMWSVSELASPLPEDSPYRKQIPAEYASGGARGAFAYHPVITHAFCFDANDGRLIWARPVSEIELLYCGEGMNIPRAAPLLLDGRIYLQTHMGSISCLSMKDGAAIWQTHISKLGSTRTPPFGKAGIGGAPFAGRGKVFFTFPVNNNNSSVTAFDPATGKVLWQKTLNTGFRVDLLSASLADIEGHPTIVVPGGYRVYGLDPESGEIWWTFDAHEQWPEISFDKTKHSATNEVYWADQHPGRIPVIYGDYIVNRVFIWGGHKDQRTYCIKIESGKPRLVWDRKTLSAWRGLYIHKDNLLLAMDYGHFTSADTLTELNSIKREAQVYDAARYQCIDIPTGKLLWGTDEFTSPHDSKQLNYACFEPEHIAAGNQVIVMHMSQLGYGTFDEKGISVKTVYKGASFWGFSPLVLNNGLLYFQRMAAVYKAANSFGGQEYNLFCLDLR